MNYIPKQDWLILAIWLSHNYRGQWSRGYRILSRLMSQYHCHWTSNLEHEAEETELYIELTEKYPKCI